MVFRFPSSILHFAGQITSSVQHPLYLFAQDRHGYQVGTLNGTSCGVGYIWPALVGRRADTARASPSRRRSAKSQQQQRSYIYDRLTAAASLFLQPSVKGRVAGFWKKIGNGPPDYAGVCLQPLPRDDGDDLFCYLLSSVLLSALQPLLAPSRGRLVTGGRALPVVALPTVFHRTMSGQVGLVGQA